MWFFRQKIVADMYNNQLKSFEAREVFVVHLVLVHSISSTSVVASQPAVAQEDAPLQIWLVSFGSVEWHAVPCVSSKAIPILGFLPSSILIQHRWFDFRVGSFLLEAEVKLRIKSFRVPELFTEIPETATVGSLKRTVMEAVTAVLGSGLRVGVLLHGKKVRDDNRTLLQTGISHDDKLDSLGFTLEPTTVHPPPQCSEDCHSLLPCDSTEPLTRYCKRAKNVFEELKKTPYVVELDLRDISSMDVVGYAEERSF